MWSGAGRTCGEDGVDVALSMGGNVGKVVVVDVEGVVVVEFVVSVGSLSGFGFTRGVDIPFHFSISRTVCLRI